MDNEINAPGHGKNIIDGINAMDKLHLKEQKQTYS